MRKPILSCFLIVLAACSVETPEQVANNNGVSVSIRVKAELPVTRTAISSKEGVSSFSFVNGDSIGFFAGDILTNYPLTCKDAEVGLFVGKTLIPPEKQQKRDNVRYYAYYPYSSNAGDNLSRLNGELPSIQTAPYDSRADYIVADALQGKYDLDDFPDLSFRFASHLFSIVKLSIKNTSPGYAEEKILRIGLKSKTAPLSGKFTFNVEDASESIIFSEIESETTDFVKVQYEESQRPTIGVGETHVVYAIVNPVTFKAGELILVVETSNHTFTLPTTNDKAITLSREEVTVFPTVDINSKDIRTHELLSFGLTDGANVYNHYKINDNVVSVQVPVGCDISNLRAIFTHNGKSIKVNGVEQTSGGEGPDFSDFTNPVEYVVYDVDGDSSTYTIMLFNLPIVIVDTPGSQPITSKETWIKKTYIAIREMGIDGTPKVTEYTNSQVKGRGNSSWNYDKKPYAVKLSQEAKVLDMPKHKRWCLLANTRGYFFGNLFGYELANRTASLAWNPHGKYVELILNGEYRGCYLLTEQIKIGENRVNITSMSSSDVSEEAVTGGYLLTYDNTFDEYNRFWSAEYRMPVMFKDPDEDPANPSDPKIKDRISEYQTLPDAQYNYVRDYINRLEASLVDKDRLDRHEYLEYIDVDTYIDQYFVWELAGTLENNEWYGSDFAQPRSVYFHKDRGGKLKAGPVWDFDTYLFHEQKFRCKDSQYYGTLFKDFAFKSRVKEKWPDFRSRIEGDGQKKSMLQYLDSLYSVVSQAARRDRVMWPYTEYVATKPAQEQYEIIKNGFIGKLNWLEAQIDTMKVTYDNRGTSTENYGGQGDKTGDFGFGF